MRKALVRVVVLIVLAALVVGGAWLWMRRPWRVVATVNGVSLTASELGLRAKALGGDLRETARTWIAKEVLLGEAVQRGVSVAEEDERATTDILASWFAAHGMTAERFFKEGPIPEQARRQDLKEGLLINALVKEGLRTASFPDFYHSLRDKAQVRCPEFPELERIDTGTPLYAGMWGWRPSRVAAVAAGQVVTAAELDLRVQNARDDLRRMGRAQPDERALRRREMQVCLSSRNFTFSPFGSVYSILINSPDSTFRFSTFGSPSMCKSVLNSSINCALNSSSFSFPPISAYRFQISSVYSPSA